MGGELPSLVLALVTDATGIAAAVPPAAQEHRNGSPGHLGQAHAHERRIFACSPALNAFENPALGIDQERVGHAGKAAVAGAYAAVVIE